MQYEFDYHQTLDELSAACDQLLKQNLGAFFNTQIRKSLSDKYLFLVAQHGLAVNGEDYAVKLRQQLSCSTCARFFNRMGSVVFMSATGAKSVYWNPDAVSDPVMKLVVADMKRFVESARIISLFNPKGSYSTYTEETNYGGQPYRHYYVDADLMVPRHPITGDVLRVPAAGTFNSRVEALVAFAMATPFSAVTIVEQWLAAGTIKHVGSSARTIVMIKGLLAAMAMLKTKSEYLDAPSDYHRETMLVNLIWRKALEDQNLLTLKTSLLGTTITKIVKLEIAGRTDSGIEAIIAFWKTNSSAIHYQRTTAVASDGKLTIALNYLEENDYIRSMEQVEAAEADIPAVWESRGAYTAIDAALPSVGGFAQYAQGQLANNKSATGMYKVPGTTDAGYFFNEILQHVESMAILIPTATRMMPSFFNKQANPDSKPIFVWDTEESPCRLTMYRYQNPIELVRLADKSVKVVSGNYQINILAVTSSLAMGVCKEVAKTNGILFLLDGMRSPIQPGPTLFATTLKGELYEYRRPIEDYSKTTQIERCVGQQAIAFPLGAFDPNADHSHRIPSLPVQVKFTPEYAAIMGHSRATYQLDLNGYHVTPDWSKFPVITDRWAKPVEDEAEVAEEPAVPAAAENATQPVLQ